MFTGFLKCNRRCVHKTNISDRTQPARAQTHERLHLMFESKQATDCLVQTQGKTSAYVHTQNLSWTHSHTKKEGAQTPCTQFCDFKGFSEGFIGLASVLPLYLSSYPPQKYLRSTNTHKPISSDGSDGFEKLGKIIQMELCKSKPLTARQNKEP